MGTRTPSKLKRRFLFWWKTRASRTTCPDRNGIRITTANATTATTPARSRILRCPVRRTMSQRLLTGFLMPDEYRRPAAARPPFLWRLQARDHTSRSQRHRWRSARLIALPAPDPIIFHPTTREPAFCIQGH